MKIALIENCNRRMSLDSDLLYREDYSYTYSFYASTSEISTEQYKIIGRYLRSVKKSFIRHFERFRESVIHQMYDIEKSTLLADKLSCQIFEPGVSPEKVYEHIISVKYTPTSDVESTEVIEHKTLSVIKYKKLIKEADAWKGCDNWSDIIVDNDDNLISYNAPEIFRISTLLADRIEILDYNSWNNYAYAVVTKGDKWGLVNSEGELLIKHQQYRIHEISEPYCIVKSGDSSSIMDFNGNLLMPFTSQFFTLHDFGYAEVIYDNFRLVYDLNTSRIILNANYSQLLHICEKLTVVIGYSGAYEIYNRDSLKINVDTLEYVSVCDNKILICKTKTGWLVYDQDGNIIFSDAEQKYTSIEISDDDHLLLKQYKSNNYPIYGLADINGNIIFPCYSDAPIKVFQDGNDSYFIIRKYKKEYLCNRNGQILSAKYDRVNRASEGICIAFDGKVILEDDKVYTNDGTFYALTLDGKVKFKINCQYLFPYSNGLATIMINDKYGKINTEGEIIIQPKYDKLEAYENGLIAACKDCQWGYIDCNDNVIVDFQYEVADSFDECSYSTSIDDDTYIKDGLAEAFNDDPSNYWNID